MTEMTIADIAYVHSFVRLRRGPFFRPGHRSRSRRAQGRSRLAAFAATARLGLDRPEHGGMLAWNGTAFLAGTCRQADSVCREAQDGRETPDAQADGVAPGGLAAHARVTGHPARVVRRSAAWTLRLLRQAAQLSSA